MEQVKRGLSYVVYDYVGGPRRFTVPFPFLDKGHVYVYAGTDLETWRRVEWVWSGTNEVEVLEGQIVETELVLLVRQTPYENLEVTFRDGAVLPAADLNYVLKQLHYLLLEQYDGSGGTGVGGGISLPPVDSDFPEIGQLIDLVFQSETMQLLITRIDEIDLNAATLLESTLRENNLIDLQRKYEDRTTRAEHRLEVIEESDQNVALEITELQASFDTAQSTADARYIEINEALASESEARTFQVQDLHAQFNENAANVQTELVALAKKDEVIAQSVETLRGTVGDNSSAIQNLSQVKITAAQAEAIATTKLQSFSSTSFAQLEQRFQTFASDTEGTFGEWSASYTLRLNGGKIGGQPVIAGLGLGLNASGGSDLIVMADRMAFVHPNYTSGGALASLKYPFVVGQVGGQSTVGINGALMVDGTIQARAIKTNTLSALTANAGEINGGTFRTFQLDANGNIRNPSEFRVEITNDPNDPWPFWIGSGVKNANNAVISFGRDGTASFDGDVRAPNIRDQLQAIAPIAWVGSINPNGGVTMEVTRFTLPGPVRAGERHRPIVMASLNVQNVSSDNGVFRTITQRLAGSTWVTVHEGQLNQGGGMGINHALSFVLSPTDQTETYRICVVEVEHGERVRIQGINGFVIGVR
ncbi:phage tail fiber protein [Coralloluteibacterium stylophorae]|uniref:DUF1983 domain-containing protein n=1 Tax=Coralloluteibacterium stylophorae TaxID=1776034 RepID=A0A8J7VRC9_9GAMM|nr:phage tail fiber protein [Coralloluteibacterium stylophorae]MBS7457698.1 DUF1983 domain-containing protein [Coralloluteibacterium stylophorae]